MWQSVRQGRRKYWIMLLVMLKPGGVIVYSTCTFSKEENEDVIEYFLERHPDFTLEEMERFWPHKVDGEGHFVAKLVRRGSVNELGADYDLCEDSCNKVEDTGLKADRKTKKNKNSKNRKNETKPALTKENMKLLSEFLDETIFRGYGSMDKKLKACHVWGAALQAA